MEWFAGYTYVFSMASSALCFSMTISRGKRGKLIAHPSSSVPFSLYHSGLNSVSVISARRALRLLPSRAHLKYQNMPMEHHPDFPKSNSTDIVLQSHDGTLFHVARAELMRASTVFSDLFEIGHATISGTMCLFASQESPPYAHILCLTDTPVSVSETSLQLEILLKLIALQSAPFEKLTRLSSAVDLWTIAAEK